MSTTPTVFTGSSAYSNDLQAVIGRAIAIRSLGLTALSTQKAQIIAQGAAVSSLDTAFSNLQNAVTAIGTSTGVSALSAAGSTAWIHPTTPSAGDPSRSYRHQIDHH